MEGDDIHVHHECEKREGGPGLLEYVRKSTPPPFLLKTYMLVEDPATDAVISWNSDGTAFVVWQPAEFARDLLPTLFKHSNFSSFVRQLNTYLPSFPSPYQAELTQILEEGFRKAATTRWEFCNDMFRRGERELLCKIRRRKAWANKQQQQQQQQSTVVGPGPAAADQNGSVQDVDDQDDQRSSSSTSSSSGYSNLVDENKRLKKENGVLCSELTSMKNKCKELLDLVELYAAAPPQPHPHPDQPPPSPPPPGKEEDDVRPMLFGVRLEVQGESERKRKRAQITETVATILLSQSCK